MTAAQMLSYFDLLYDVNGSAAVAGFVESEKYGFLNKAQELVVTEFCVNRNWERVEELMKYNDFRLTLSTSYGSPCYITTALEYDYLYYITSRTKLTRTANPVIATAEWIENIKIPMELIGRFQQNSINETHFHNPRVIDEKHFAREYQRDIIRFTGSSGSGEISVAGGLTKTITFNSSLLETNFDFVTANFEDYLAEGIIISYDGADLIFTSDSAGVSFDSPEYTNIAGTLDGEVTSWVNVDDDMDHVFLVFVDSYTVPERFLLQYISKPLEISSSQDCILREELHRFIVEKALELALATVADPRVMVLPKNEVK